MSSQLIMMAHYPLSAQLRIVLSGTREGLKPTGQGYKPIEIKSYCQIKMGRYSVSGYVIWGIMGLSLTLK